MHSKSSCKDPYKEWGLTIFLSLIIVTQWVGLEPYARSLIWAATLSLFLFSTSAQILLIGILTPVIPMLGVGSLLSLALVVILLSPQTERTYFKAVFPLLLLAILSLFATQLPDVQIFDLVHALGQYPDATVAVKGKIFYQEAKAFLTGAHLIGCFVMIPLFADLLTSKQTYKQHYLRGVLYGSFFALVLTIVNIVNAFPALFINQNSYWTTLNRSAGSFSDPNAFGVFIALLLPIAMKSEFLNLNLYLKYFWSILWTIAALYSGSRSFILGMITWTLFVIGKRFFSLYGWKTITFVGGLCICFVVVINLFPGKISPQELPESLSRSLQSMQFSRMEEEFFSRTLFWRVALRMWWDDPLLGVGFSKFRDLFLPYAHSIAPSVGVWTDNANSMYLGVLVELGLLGVLTAFLVFRRFRRNREDESAQPSLLILGVLLLFGPHLEFEEVSLLVGLIVSCAVVPFNEYMRIRAPLVALVLTLFFGRFFSAEYGIWGWEKDASGYFRWTSASASTQISCNNERAQLVLQPLAPPGIVQEIDIDTNWEHLSDRMPGEMTYDLKCPIGKALHVSLQTHHPWIPILSHLAEDARVLGVKIRYASPSSLIGTLTPLLR